MRKRGLVDRDRPVKSVDDLMSRFNDYIAEGFSLKNGLSGEIIDISFAPNEEKQILHGLGSVPRYRLILRQEGNGLITDVSSKWTDQFVTLLNNSANAVKITIKLFVE